MAERFIRQLRGFRDRYVAAEAIRRAPDGYVCEVRQATRSLEQNARLWPLLTEVSKQVTWYGRRLPAAEWKNGFMLARNGVEMVPGIREGSIWPLGLSTRQLTVPEFGDLMTSIEAFGAEHNVVFFDRCANVER